MSKKTHIDDVIFGDTLIADEGFTCMEAGPHVVKIDPDYEGVGQYYVDCDEGKHFIDGQEDEDGYLIGLVKK